MRKGYDSFKTFFEKEQIAVEASIEKAAQPDKNIFNNRLFLWQFDSEDLLDFYQIFSIYKNSPSSIASRQVLNRNLTGKINGMLQEGYNPIECMLYASKLINKSIKNDKELQELLALKIRDIYLKKEEDSRAILENIIQSWTWVPQIQLVIYAIGIIGSDQQLLDMMMRYYGEDPVYKTSVFYALLQNKTLENLERAMQIIVTLQDTSEDTIIGKVFIRQIDEFGIHGCNLIKEQYDNPCITKTGKQILRKILIRINGIGPYPDPTTDLYRQNLANKSQKDDLIYKDFLKDCYTNFDDNAFYLARFSRPEIGVFLKEALESPDLNTSERNTAILSLGIIGLKGYHPAASILDTCRKHGGNEYAVTVAQIMLGESASAKEIADILSSKKNFQLSSLYTALRGSSIINYDIPAALLGTSLEHKFQNLLTGEDFHGLECFASNLCIFWDKKLFRLLTRTLLNQIRMTLTSYTQNTVTFSTATTLSLIEVLAHDWNSSTENTIFTLYRYAKDERVREYCFKKLNERNIDAPNH